MSYFTAIAATILSAVSSYQVLFLDDISQPLVAATLGYSLGYFGTHLVLKVMNELE